MVCDFCRSRQIRDPCVKVPGPNTYRRLSPSRPIATPIDCTLTPEEGLLLQYAYAGPIKWDSLLSFFRVLASNYGPSLPTSALRSAVLASAAYALPAEQFKSIRDHHEAQGWKSISPKLHSGALLTDEEAFAACILADMAWDAQPTSPNALHTIQRSKSCLELAVGRSREKAPSNMFKIFGPFFQDGLRFSEMTGITFHAKPGEWRFPQRGSFKRRLDYYEEFRRVQTKASVMGMTAAVFDTLQEIMHGLACCITRAAWEEIYGDNTATNERLDEAVQSIRTEFSNTTLQQCIALVKNPPSDKECLERSAAQYLEILLELIRIQFELFKTPSIIQSIAQSDTNMMARALIASIGSTCSLTPSLRCWQTYGASILSIGMVLSPEDSARRIIPLISLINVM